MVGREEDDNVVEREVDCGKGFGKADLAFRFKFEFEFEFKFELDVLQMLLKDSLIPPNSTVANAEFSTPNSSLSACSIES